MRKNLSWPILSPPPPYPAPSPRKEAYVVPATAPPSPDLTTWDTSVPLRGPGNMRATHIRPRTAPASPQRPGTGYSTRSTIRQVQPSPDSVSEALTNGFADGGTAGPRPRSRPRPGPGPEPSLEPFPPFDSAQDGYTTTEDYGTHITSTEPAMPVGALRRGGTPSKPRSCSPEKARSTSPRKHLIRTPTLPAHHESPSSSYSGLEWDAPDTPSPVTPEQQRDAYAPLRIRRPLVKASGEAELAVGQGTHARIADHMQRMKGLPQRSGGASQASDARVSKGEGRMSEPGERVVSTVPHIVSAMLQASDAEQLLSPFSASQKRAKQEHGKEKAEEKEKKKERGKKKEKEKEKEKEPARHTSVSRRSEASGASVTSRRSIFSTPGRDEMERKKPIIEEDEGPFANATGMRDLEQRRRRLSEEPRDGEKRETKILCGMRCMVM